MPAQPRRVAGRTAGDEDHDVADARPVEGRALAAAKTASALCAQAGGDDLDDFFAVKPSILDEDRPRIHAGDRAAGNEHARHVGFERLWIVNGRVTVVEADTGGHEKLRVRAIASQQE